MNMKPGLTKILLADVLFAIGTANHPSSLHQGEQYVSRAGPDSKDCRSQGKAERKTIQDAIIFAIEHMNS